MKTGIIALAAAAALQITSACTQQPANISPPAGQSTTPQAAAAAKREAQNDAYDSFWLLENAKTINNFWHSNIKLLECDLARESCTVTIGKYVALHATEKPFGNGPSTTIGFTRLPSNDWKTCLGVNYGGQPAWMQCYRLSDLKAVLADLKPGDFVSKQDISPIRASFANLDRLTGSFALILNPKELRNPALIECPAAEEKCYAFARDKKGDGGAGVVVDITPLTGSDAFSGGDINIEISEKVTDILRVAMMGLEVSKLPSPPTIELSNGRFMLMPGMIPVPG